jgi:hypothetical protein
MSEEKRGPKEASKEQLREEIDSLKQEIYKLKELLNSLSFQHPASDILPMEDANKTEHAKNQTNSLPLPFKTPLFSTGNEGVQTNRQTDKNQTEAMLEKVNQFRTDLKYIFRRLTKQEFRVFSAIYLLEEQGIVDYTTLANKLGLSETAIRDYIMKIKRKGVPILKTKINNKKVFLSIKPELKELVSLESLIKFREPIIV